MAPLPSMVRRALRSRSPRHPASFSAVDDRAHIHSVELNVADLERSRRFYTDAIGLEPVGDDPLALGAGGRPLVILREAVPGTPAPPSTTGLFHLAILHPSRAELATALRRLAELGGRLDGASDHAVSEALYLHDPDWNGIELYRDRPKQDWPEGPEGGVGMVTLPLDVQALIGEAEAVDGRPAHPDTVMGHVHLRVSDLERSVAFYRDELGMNLRARYGDQAAFLAAGDYHHHVGINTWQSLGGGAPPPRSAGIERFTITAPAEEGQTLSDPDGIELALKPSQ
jgi:catechol 2,3-dioxygenase